MSQPPGAAARPVSNRADPDYTEAAMRRFSSRLLVAIPVNVVNVVYVVIWVVFGVVALGASACHGPRSTQLTGRASDEWSRTYPLERAGEVEIGGAGGSITVEAVSGGSVAVRATRIARAPTDAAAREVLPRLKFREAIQPAKVSIQSGRLEGIVIGVEIEVNYQVTVPDHASVRLRMANGTINVSGIGGTTFVSATNGHVIARALAGGVTARATNGNLTIDLAALGSDPVELRATNGSVRLVMPQAANANLLATATNGRIDAKGLALTPFGEQGPRRVRGRINTGGTPIEVSTVNGTIEIEGR
jgi:Putative adhesin